MRLIPGKTKVKVELFKGVGIGDMIIGLIAGVLIVLLATSSLPGKFYICLGVAILAVMLLVRLDTEPNYEYLLHILRHFGYRRNFSRTFDDANLSQMNDAGEKEVAFKAVFGGKKEADYEQETPEQRKARIKAEKAERKADDKILKSKTASKEEQDAIWLKRAQQSAEKKKAKNAKKTANDSASAHDMGEIIGFTDISDDLIHYGGKYFGAAIEIPPVEFRFLSAGRRTNSIENGVGRILRALPAEFAANIVKIERPALYDEYLDNEYDKLDELRNCYEKGFITEEELKSRVEVLYDRINDLRNICYEQKVVQPFYYIVLFDSDRQQLNNSVRTALDNLHNNELLKAHRLDSKELAVFLKYTNQIDFDERDVEKIAPKDYAAWAMPQKVSIKPRTTVINDIVAHNLRVVGYPAFVDDAWMATVMSMPGTKVMIKCTPMDRAKSVRGIDHSLQELRAQYNSTGVDSKRIELANHIQTLEGLLSTLQGDNETLLSVNIYVTAYDINLTRLNPAAPQPPISTLANVANMKRVVRRLYNEQNLRLNNMEFDQVNAFIGAQVNAWDPLSKQGRGIPSNSVAAAYPWVFAHVADKNGIKLGSEGGVPVFIDFFRRDSERVNSNMVIVGKSGSGKSYATKSLLTNLAADDSKIFILDPENEYSELATNLHGKFINVGNAQYGRLNPFHIITALDDDESSGTVSGSYATHLQFLEEFFRQILPDCEKDAMEYLNSIIDRMYTNRGITAETDLSKLQPEDYPVFDDLYDAILTEFQSTDNEYIRTMLRTLMNYIAKFSAGGRNSNIWNGPSTVTTEENFTVFNFQSLLANRNGTIANAQMLLVLKYIDNEIIKNRDYNTKYGLKRKVVVVIDEAHVFIDAKFPVALDFMFQLAKRIRKYNGMQLVITQNIKDFVGSEEIARKSTAIINACQYSFIFSLAPNDMGDLCKLYEKAGGINENEQEQIVSAPRGQAFTIMSAQSRSTFRVEVPDDVVAMFQESEYQSRYFSGESGEANWEDYMGDSRDKRITPHSAAHKKPEEEQEEGEEKPVTKRISFEEVTDEELEAAEREAANKKKKPSKSRLNTLASLDTLDDFPEIPEDPEEFARMAAARRPAAAPVMVQPAAPVMVQPAAPNVVVQAAAPNVVVQSAAPNVVVQAPETSAETERMLGELLGRFSYDSMMEEIRRSVREEMEREKAARAAERESAPPVQTAPELPQTGEMQNLGTIFNSEAMEEAQRLQQEEAKAARAAESESSEEDGGFDIMALLAVEAERLGNISPIEMMVTYDEEVIEVSLEELMAYNKKQI